MKRITAFCTFILCLDIVAPFPFPEEHLGAYNPSQTPVQNNFALNAAPRTAYQNGPELNYSPEALERSRQNFGAEQPNPSRPNNFIPDSLRQNYNTESRYEPRLAERTAQPPVPPRQTFGPELVNQEREHVVGPGIRQNNEAEAFRQPGPVQNIIGPEPPTLFRENVPGSETIAQSQNENIQEYRNIPVSTSVPKNGNSERVETIPRPTFTNLQYNRNQIAPQIGTQNEYAQRESEVNIVAKPYVHPAANANIYPSQQHIQEQPLPNSPSRPWTGAAPANTEQYIQSARNPAAQFQYQQGNNLQNILTNNQAIRDVVSTTQNKKRYLVVHANGQVEHIDDISTIAKQHPNYLLVKAGEIPPGLRSQVPTETYNLPAPAFNSAPSTTAAASTAVIPPPAVSTAVVPPPPVSPAVISPQPVSTSVDSPPPSSTAVVPPPPVSPAVVSPPPVSTSVGSPPPASTAVVPPPPVSPVVVPPPPVSTATVPPPVVAPPPPVSTAVVPPPPPPVSVVPPPTISPAVVPPPNISPAVVPPPNISPAVSDTSPERNQLVESVTPTFIPASIVTSPKTLEIPTTDSLPDSAAVIPLPVIPAAPVSTSTVSPESETFVPPPACSEDVPPSTSDSKDTIEKPISETSAKPIQSGTVQSSNVQSSTDTSSVTNSKNSNNISSNSSSKTILTENTTKNVSSDNSSLNNSTKDISSNSSSVNSSTTSNSKTTPNSSNDTSSVTSSRSGASNSPSKDSTSDDTPCSSVPDSSSANTSSDNATSNSLTNTESSASKSEQTNSSSSSSKTSSTSKNTSTKSTSTSITNSSNGSSDTSSTSTSTSGTKSNTSSDNSSSATSSGNTSNDSKTSNNDSDSSSDNSSTAATNTSSSNKVHSATSSEDTTALSSSEQNCQPKSNNEANQSKGQNQDVSVLCAANISKKGKPLVWFATNDSEFWNKLFGDEPISVVYFFEMPSLSDTKA